MSYRVLMAIVAFVGLLVGCAKQAPTPTPTTVGTGIRGEIVIPTGFEQVDLYSDSELFSFAQFGTTPGSAIKLTRNVHIEYIDYTERAVFLKGSQGTLHFNHVRVLDGLSRGSEGWMAQQLLPPISK